MNKDNKREIETLQLSSEELAGVTGGLLRSADDGTTAARASRLCGGSNTCIAIIETGERDL